jgi:hypothetical protein
MHTLDSLIKNLKSKDIENTSFILDSGFFSNKNVDALLSRDSLRFTLSIPIRDKWLEEVLDKYSSSMFISDNHHYIDVDEYIYSKTQPYNWSNYTKPLYLHIYYDEHLAIIDHEHLINDLKEYKEFSEDNDMLPELDDYYSKYITIQETSDGETKIILNNDKILEYKNKYAGYFCILSNFANDSVETLKSFRNKDIVENFFEDIFKETDKNLKNSNIIKNIDTKIFLHFLASIFKSQITTIMKTAGIEGRSPKSLLLTLANLQKTNVLGTSKVFYTNINPWQVEYLEAFGLTWPS